MSSWGGNKIHFREKKSIQSAQIQPVLAVQQSEQQVSQIPKSNPSRWVIPNYFAVVCAIALNEEPYIDEWINYNRVLGFSHIYIYDNSENYSLKNKESDFVTVIHFPGPVKQLQAYDIFVTSYNKKHT